MRLEATSAGQIAPRDHFDARVHSVFASAANLVMDDGLLVTLLTADQARLPRGIRLNTPADFNFEGCLRQGSAAACRGGIIRFAGSTFEVDLRGAQVWRCDLKALGVDLRQPAARRGWHIARDDLQQHPAAISGIAGAAFDIGGLRTEATPLVRAARGPVQTLIESAHHLDVTGSAAAAAKLIGLGPGLTPSGDDFLTGFLAGLWASAAKPRRIDFISKFGASVSDLAGRTTDISRAFLLDAARGQVSELVITLIEAIRDGTPAGVQRATQSALGAGSTSGADGVAGLLAGLSVWQPPG